MNAYYVDRALFDAPNRPAGISTIEMREIGSRSVFSLQGDNLETISLVVGGLLRLARIAVDGREVSLAYLSGGDVLTTDTICPYQTTAESRAIVAQVPRDVFSELCSHNPAFAARIDRSLHRRSSLLERRAEYAHCLTIVRIANALLEISTHLNDPIVLPRVTTHQVIGTFASTIREVVSVEMPALISGGAVSKRGRQLALDRERLGDFVRVLRPRRLRTGV